MPIIRPMAMKPATKLSTALLALVFGATACISDDPNIESTGTTNLDRSQIQLTSGLQTVGNCDALLDRLIDEGLERVGPYGLNGNNFYGFGGPAILEEAMDDSAVDFDAGAPTASPAVTDRVDGGDSGGASGGDEFSGTNNQEAGVDESDIVKTDGNRLVVVNGNQLRILDITGDAPVLTSTVKLPENAWGGELFLAGDQALLMTSGWSAVPMLSSRSVVGYPGTSTTSIITVDLKSGTVGRTLEFNGNYLSAREVDGSVRIVVTAGMGHDFGWLYPSNPGAEDAAEKANRDLLSSSTVEDWLPSFRIMEGKTLISDGLLAPCERIHLPVEFSGFGTLAVITVDANNGFALGDTMGVVTDGQTVYASPDRLTVATPRYPEWDPTTGELVEGQDDYRTALHTFDIADPMKTDYVASGSVPGYLLSQYSISEHNGYLRVATTTNSPWGGGQEESESAIAVLQEIDGVLTQVGNVGGLGKSEQIFAVRYQGDLAYVVTFRQTDPLYVIDLSDPNNPVARGELKIPGFSNYLHPLANGMLLGVGQDATDEGRTTGGQLSLFDVSDPDNPTRVSTFDLGKNSYSSVQNDPRAFTWWEKTETAFVPTTRWGWDEATNTDENSSAVLAVQINDNGFNELGRIEHPSKRECEGEVYPVEPRPFGVGEDVDGIAVDDIAVDEVEPAPSIQPVPDRPEYEYCWVYAPELQRTVIAGDKVLTISQGGVASHRLSDFNLLGYVSFES